MADNLSDIQWCVLDLLLRAKRTGASRVNRLELMRSDALPDALKVKLVFTALTMAGGPFVRLHGQHDFEITDAGERMFNERIGAPSKAADAVIALPDQSRQVLQ
ncbi:hypothetical protein FHX08_002035 [Rhizobium sp. BK529]|uniref:hypothetical protein n=1 Tax=Rhizobium sp. BK529 TaxID=2586983 RepID=UPI00161D8102|nr:hypothetical protein [Rhizobium sp. BK529]MBB3591691.1 hypothetical protein [Rhizobium sp. BK529]